MVRRFGMIVLCALVAGACSSKAATPSVSAPRSAAPDAAALLASAAAAMQALSSYRVVSVVTTRTAKGPVAVKVDAAFERPGRVSTLTTIGARSVATITIGGVTWVRNTSGAWKRAPSGASPAAAPTGSSFSFLSSVTDASIARREQASGGEAYVVAGTVPFGVLSRAFGATATTAGAARVTMWIDVSTHRLLRVAESGSQSFTVDAAISGFDARFAIAAPM